MIEKIVNIKCLFLTTMPPLIAALLGALFSAALILAFRRREALRSKDQEELEWKKLRDIADLEAQKVILEAKEKSSTLFEKIKKEESDRQEKLSAFESRLLEKDKSLDRRDEDLRVKESVLIDRDKKNETEKEALKEKENEVIARLESVAQLSKVEAKDLLFDRVRKENAASLAETLSRLERERREEIEKKAGEIITTALERYSRSHITELSTCVFTLKSEEFKGKIIGREGRNVKTLERLTGVDFIFDESPESITISSFDPIRREIARLALDKLIRDGRIQPAKIEEKVEEARGELEKRIMEFGEEAVYELGIVDFPKEIVKLLGQLHFRTSYGQNVLHHSVEMAHLAGMIAKEIGADVMIAKKGALVHDIGKAIDHEVEGTHIELGRKILEKAGVDRRVIQAMEAHHNDYPHATPEAFIVTAVDALSGGRPGARRDSSEMYLKRLGDLERIALSFPGVKTAYAISGGREVRIFVTPERIDDFGALELAKNVADRIRSEMTFPGEIKVNVIRELRATEIAR